MNGAASSARRTFISARSEVHAGRGGAAKVILSLPVPVQWSKASDPQPARPASSQKLDCDKKSPEFNRNVDVALGAGSNLVAGGRMVLIGEAAGSGLQSELKLGFCPLPPSIDRKPKAQSSANQNPRKKVKGILLRRSF